MRKLVQTRYLFALASFAAILGIYFFPAVTSQSAQERPSYSSQAKFEKFRSADGITAKIRSNNREIVRVDISSIDDRKDAEKLGTIIQDFGSFVIVSKEKRSKIDSSKLKIETIGQSINLPGAEFDPVSETPPETIAPTAQESSIEGGYCVVQFGGIATDEWLESLNDDGLEVLQYLPQNAFLVHGDGAAISNAAKHSRVRWVGRFSPGHKLPKVLKAQLSEESEERLARNGIAKLEKTTGDTAIFDIAVFARADVDRAAEQIESLAGAAVKSITRLPNNYFNLIRANVRLDRVDRITEIEDVIRIDAWSKPTKEDERAAQIVAGNYANATSITGPGYDPQTQFGVTGNGVTVSVVDDGISIPGNGGFYLTSMNTANAPLYGAAAGATGGHGHLNATIIAGSAPFGGLDPLGYNYGKGIAPGASILNIPLLLAGYPGQDNIPYDDTVMTAGRNGSRGYISNNSWGISTNGNTYDSYTAQFDGFVRDASTAASIDPIVLVFSAGNSGPEGLSLTRPKAAKNMISVGNSENIRTEIGNSNADNMDDLRGSSSRGPTADGRIKPDIVAPGSYVTGGRAGSSCNSVTSCFDANHSFSIGTSHAAPQVTGAAALFTEFWRNGHAGQNPSPALVKAAILDTGQDMNGLNTLASIPNGNEGWGRINMKLMLNTGVPMKYVNETSALSNVGESFSFSGVVSDSSKPVRIGLVWTDPPAAADPALVNNLDLNVTVNGITYRGNVFAGGQSTSGGVSDTRNNVEHVWLPAGLPAGAAITIQVTAAALNGDGILQNADPTDQHFALVGYNFVDAIAPNTSVRSDFDGDGKTDVAVWRPSTGEWWAMRSSDNVVTASAFGISSDIIVPGDYDGDAKTDVAIWRPSTGVWYINLSAGGAIYTGFGVNGDIPVAADYDGDGKTDIAVWRPSDGIWYLLRSTAGFTAANFGSLGDKPVTGDYDGDGRSDLAVYRPSTGTWYILRSTAGMLITNFGISTDQPVQADYDGDGKTDIAVWRSAGGTWYQLLSGSGITGGNFGIATDRPIPGDFDGDSRADIGIYRGAGGVWFELRSQLGFGTAQLGTTGDIPIPAGYIPQ